MQADYLYYMDYHNGEDRDDLSVYEDEDPADCSFDELMRVRSSLLNESIVILTQDIF